MEKLMNQKTKWSRVIVIVAGLAGLSTLSFNCGGKKFDSAMGQEDSSSVGTNTTPGTNYDSSSSPYALLTTEQIFKTMLNVTGQTAPTTTQSAEFNLRTGSLPETNNLNSINAPLMMASTSLAGEVCNGLLTSEKALADGSRKFFNGIDFTKTIDANNANAYSSSAEAMAQAFYDRSLTSDEQAMLTDFYSEFVSGLPANATAAQTTNLYLSLCTGMLASFDAIVY